MQRSQHFWLGAAVCLLMAAVLALPALASSKDDDRPALLSGEDVIYRGIDLWTTPADGRTYSNFAQQPIPAGFFCQGSAPFSGKITFKGGELQTVPADAIDGADTIIERLDDAVFDSEGLARTRLRFLALSLTSIEPLQTNCGSFRADVRLEGNQPVTSMQIRRRGADSGTFSSRISLNAQITFTPLGVAEGEPLKLSQQIRFAPNQGAPWARTPGESARPAANYARVDVDGDGNAETAIPALGNFRAGVVLHNGILQKVGTLGLESFICHCDPSKSFDDEFQSPIVEICEHMHCNF